VYRLPSLSNSSIRIFRAGIEWLTLRDVHKLYTSQLIAVMVKSIVVKSQFQFGKDKIGWICTGFIITTFTGIWFHQTNSSPTQLHICIGSVGGSSSQKRTIKIVIVLEIEVEMRQFYCKFTRTSQNVNSMWFEVLHTRWK